MAAVYISTVKKTVDGASHIVEPNEISNGFDFTTVSDTTNGAYLARSYDASNNVTDEFKDQKTTILFYNASTSDCTVKIKAGDAYAAFNDLPLTVESGKYAYAQIDSAYFKVVSGGYGDSLAKQGAVRIVPEASIKVALIESR